jgi:hypothetical protein
LLAAAPALSITINSVLPLEAGSRKVRGAGAQQSPVNLGENGHFNDNLVLKISPSRSRMMRMSVVSVPSRSIERLPYLILISLLVGVSQYILPV